MAERGWYVERNYRAWTVKKDSDKPGFVYYARGPKGSVSKFRSEEAAQHEADKRNKSESEAA